MLFVWEDLCILVNFLCVRKIEKNIVLEQLCKWINPKLLINVRTLEFNLVFVLGGFRPMALMAIEQWMFLAWHTYCDTGHPFIIVISEDHNTHTPIAEHLSSGDVTTFFYDLGLSRFGFEHPTFRMRGEGPNPLGHRHGETIRKMWNKCKIN